MKPTIERTETGITRIADYPPYAQAVESLCQAKNRLTKLKAELDQAQAEPIREYRLESAKASIEHEEGRGSAATVTKARGKVDDLNALIAELTDKIEWTEQEVEVKSELVDQEREAAKQLVFQTLESEHKAVCRKFLAALNEAIKLNGEIFQLQRTVEIQLSDMSLSDFALPTLETENSMVIVSPGQKPCFPTIKTTMGRFVERLEGYTND